MSYKQKKDNVLRYLKKDPPEGGGGGVFRISSDGDGRMQNPKKSLGLPTKAKKKSLDEKLTPKKPYAEFPALKNFKKGLRDITRTTQSALPRILRLI